MLYIQDFIYNISARRKLRQPTQKIIIVEKYYIEFLILLSEGGS